MRGQAFPVTLRGAPSRAGGPPPALWGAGILVAALCALPLLYLVLRTAGAPAQAWQAVAARSSVLLAIRSLVFAAAVTAAATALALPMAWLTARSDLPGRRTMGVLAALPLAVPSYVAALAATSALGPRGLLQQALAPLGVERLPSIYGFWGATAVLALVSYPYLFMVLQPAMRALDPRLEELSRGFGHGRWTTWRRVVLPQLRPALTTGALLVALYALSDFGAVSLLRLDTLTRVIFIRYESSFDRVGASALALLLAALALALASAELASRRGLRYHSAHGERRPPPPVPLGRWRWPAAAFVALVLALALALPLLVLGYWLGQGLAAGEAVSGVFAAARNSLLAAALGAVAAAAAAVPVALLGVRYPRLALSRAVGVLAYSGYALPGLVVALALVFAAIRLGTLYQTVGLLVMAYVLLFLPQALGATRVALLQVRPSVEEAARGLGRRPWQVLTSITAPLAGRGIVAGAALVFLTAMKELPATLLLSPPGFETLAVRVWSASSEAFFARAALPALVLVALSALALLLSGLLDRGGPGTEAANR